MNTTCTGVFFSILQKGGIRKISQQVLNLFSLEKAISFRVTKTTIFVTVIINKLLV